MGIKAANAVLDGAEKIQEGIGGAAIGAAKFARADAKQTWEDVKTVGGGVAKGVGTTVGVGVGLGAVAAKGAFDLANKAADMTKRGYQKTKEGLGRVKEKGLRLGRGFLARGLERMGAKMQNLGASFQGHADRLKPKPEMGV
jgi:hypothetical protein